MTQQRGLNSGFNEVAAGLPPDVAPSFGDVPTRPFEHTPERLVLFTEPKAAARNPSGPGLTASRRRTPGLAPAHRETAPRRGPHTGESSPSRPRPSSEARVAREWLTRPVDARTAPPTSAWSANLRLPKSPASPSKSPHRSRMRAGTGTGNGDGEPGTGKRRGARGRRARWQCHHAGLRRPMFALRQFFPEIFTFKARSCAFKRRVPKAVKSRSARASENQVRSGLGRRPAVEAAGPLPRAPRTGAAQGPVGDMVRVAARGECVIRTQLNGRATLRALLAAREARNRPIRPPEDGR